MEPYFSLVCSAPPSMKLAHGLALEELLGIVGPPCICGGTSVDGDHVATVVVAAHVRFERRSTGANTSMQRKTDDKARHLICQSAYLQIIED